MTPKETDGTIELVVDPDECFTTDDEEVIEHNEVMRLRKRKMKDNKLNKAAKTKAKKHSGECKMDL